MRLLALFLLAGAILILGFEKQAEDQKKVRLLREYALSLEHLKQLIVNEKYPLPQALMQAGQGSIEAYFLALKAQLTGGRAAQPPLVELALPVEVLSSPESQTRILNALILEVNEKRQAFEQQLPDRRRSAMTFSAAVAALCVIVLM